MWGRHHLLLSGRFLSCSQPALHGTGEVGWEETLFVGTFLEASEPTFLLQQSENSFLVINKIHTHKPLQSPRFKSFTQDVHIAKTMVELQRIEAEDDRTMIEMRAIRLEGERM